MRLCEHQDYQLAGQDEVQAMLQSLEYAEIKKDYDAISREHFARDYFSPEDMRFARSDALYPAGELADTLAGEYEQQCRMLCYGPFPSWAEVRDRFNDFRSLL